MVEAGHMEGKLCLLFISRATFHRIIRHDLHMPSGGFRNGARLMDQLRAILTSHDAYVFAAGFLAGVAAIRRLTRWTLGGKA